MFSSSESAMRGKKKREETYAIKIIIREFCQVIVSHFIGVFLLQIT